MNQLKAYIGTILGIVILIAGLLPALHAFDHEKPSEGDFDLKENLTNASIDCNLCDFHISNAEAPSFFNFKIFIPQKETIYSISLAETVNLFPDPLFSLRAPPVVVS